MFIVASSAFRSSNSVCQSGSTREGIFYLKEVLWYSMYYTVERKIKLASSEGKNRISFIAHIS